MCGMLSIHGLVSDQDWNLFAQNVVYKNDTDIVVSGMSILNFLTCY